MQMAVFVVGVWFGSVSRFKRHLCYFQRERSPCFYESVHSAVPFKSLVAYFGVFAQNEVWAW